MTSPDGSLEDISSGDEFELVDGDSPHENFICYQDEGWSIVSPSEAETEIGAVDDELLGEVVHLTAEHSSLLTASTGDLTRLEVDAKSDVQLRQVAVPLMTVNDGGETLHIFHDHFDDEDFHVHIEDENDLIAWGKISSENLSLDDGGVDVDLGNDIYIESLADAAVSGTSSDTAEEPLQELLNVEDGVAHKEPSNVKKLFVAISDAGIEELHSFELCSQHVEENVPMSQSVVFDGDSAWENCVVVNCSEDRESLGVTRNECGETLHLDLTSNECSSAYESHNRLPERNDVESVRDDHRSENELTLAEVIDSETLRLCNKFEDDCDEFVDSEFENDFAEFGRQYDHFPQNKFNNRKVDRYGCRLRKKQRRDVIRAFTWRSCYYHY